MSLSTPILTGPPLCAAAPPALSATAAAAAHSTLNFISVLPSNSEILVQLADIRVERVVGDHVDDLAMLDDIMAVRQCRGKAEVLLHQQDGETLLLQRADDGADLLHDDRGQALGRLIEQEQLGTGPQDAADGEHLLLAAGKLRALAFAPLREIGEDGVDLVDAHTARLH